MNHKENMNSGRTPKARKTATLLVAIVLLLGVAVGTTVAYLITNTGSVVNKFEYAKTNVTVDEEFDGAKKENVQVRNEGNIPVYVRATYVVNWVKDGKIVASVPTDYKYDLTVHTQDKDSRWVKGTYGYYYYLDPVQPNKSTDGSLLTCTVTYPANPEYTLSVEILATAIQSEPATAVESAWGVKVGTDGKLIVPSATTN